MNETSSFLLQDAQIIMSINGKYRPGDLIAGYAISQDNVEDVHNAVGMKQIGTLQNQVLKIVVVIGSPLHHIKLSFFT